MQGNRAAAASSPSTRTSTTLDDKKNLKVTVDFRQVYASLIEQWLGTAADAVIPNAASFGRVKLVR